MEKSNRSKNLHKHLNLVAEIFLRDSIRKENPEWIDDDGECKKCDDYYDSLIDAVVVK